MFSKSAYLVWRIEQRRAMLVLGSRTLDRLPGSLDELAVIEATRVHLEPPVAEELTEYPKIDLERILKAIGGVPLLVKEAIDTGITPASHSQGVE